MTDEAKDKICKVINGFCYTVICLTAIAYMIGICCWLCS